MNLIRHLIGVGIYVVGYPYWMLYLNGSTRSRVVVTYQGKVLLVQHILGTFSWGLPGGGLDRGESAEQAGSRELAEELEIEIEPDQFKQVGVFPVRMGFARFTMICVHQDLKHKPSIKPKAWEIAKVGYFDKRELQSLSMREAERRIVADCLNSPKMLP